MIDYAVISCEILLLAGIVINMFRFQKKNKKLKEMVSLQKDRIREEKLDSMLQNQVYLERNETNGVTNNPYDVAYHEEDIAAYEEAREHISIQVEEYGVLSTKKYVVHVFEHIEIGRDDINKIVLNDVAVARQQLQLLRVEGRLFVKNLAPEVKVILKRAKKNYPLKEEAVCLQSRDELQLGKTTLRLTLI